MAEGGGQGGGISQSSFWYVNFFSGGIAGVISKTVVAPFDRVKILLQVRRPFSSPPRL